ncbi:ROK family transcriptional regulator [Paenibacillus sp. SYP-B3998]|uniref:ROK family transcriptional regulator n=1 Tax=Paenibacillus sp. SYP-B3998 TaxID=2678564 RepID=A0A6G3ZSG2_9BACL|nr:ROK family transcriptional regulator [Paenibacillus sp. SYP-B3998]NEW04978.1 ROK family transcriptional regulator [Paenibacillus sp. SYP-B3998]
MKEVTGNLQLMKKINSSLILNLIHREASVSRAEISQKLKLSPTTVSALVDELIKQSLIDEIGEKSSQGAGRKAIALEISRDKGYIISIGLGNNHFNAALINFHNEIVYEFQQPIIKGNERIYQFIKKSIDILLGASMIKEQSHIRGIAISSPGIIDEFGETILTSTLLQINNLEIKKMLDNEYNYPIIVVNDVKAAAFSEYYSGTRKTENLFFLSIDYGIGTGLIIDGKIYKGYKGASGEIGHIQIDPNGLLCQCGKIGCIETALTEPYILIKAQNAARKSKITHIPQTFDEFLERYEKGEAWAEETMKATFFLIVQMLAAFINFISPEVLVLSGWVNRSEKLMRQLKLELSQFPFPIPFEETRIVPASFGEKNFLIGAATLMLHQLFRAYI